MVHGCRAEPPQPNTGDQQHTAAASKSCRSHTHQSAAVIAVPLEAAQELRLLLYRASDKCCCCCSRVDHPHCFQGSSVVPPHMTSNPKQLAGRSTQAHRQRNCVHAWKCLDRWRPHADAHRCTGQDTPHYCWCRVSLRRFLSLCFFILSLRFRFTLSAHIPASSATSSSSPSAAAAVGAGAAASCMLLLLGISMTPWGVK